MPFKEGRVGVPGFEMRMKQDEGTGLGTDTEQQPLNKEDFYFEVDGITCELVEEGIFHTVYPEGATKEQADKVADKFALNLIKHGKLRPHTPICPLVDMGSSTLKVSGSDIVEIYNLRAKLNGGEMILLQNKSRFVQMIGNAIKVRFIHDYAEALEVARGIIAQGKIKNKQKK